MQDSKTILPAAVLVSLYKDTLVLSDIEIKDGIITNNEEKIAKTSENNHPIELPKVKKTIGPLRHLGDHNKKILVIVNDPNSVYLNEADFILLTSILNACKFTIADIALVNIGNQETNLHQILETLPSTTIICFDIASADLKIKLPNTLYKINVLGESHLFFSKALSTMHGSGADAKQEKATLWTILKKLFAL